MTEKKYINKWKYVDIYNITGAGTKRFSVRRLQNCFKLFYMWEQNKRSFLTQYS